MRQTFRCIKLDRTVFLHWLMACLVFLILAIGLFSACQQTPKLRKERLQVVASIYPVTDWARQIGGEKVEVYTLLPAGTSPHAFEPTPDEVRRLAQSDVFFKIGLGLESWAEKLVEATAGTSLRVVTLADSITMPGTTQGLTVHLPAHDHAESPDEHQHLTTDPHVWLDPVLAQDMVNAIAKTYAAIDPPNAQYYETRLDEYSEQLRALDEEIRRTTSGFTRREFITVHDFLAHFALRYNLRQVAVIEASPGKTPSPTDITRIVHIVRSMPKPVIFREPQLSDKMARVIAHEIGAPVDILDPLGTPDDPERDTYIKLMKINAETLERYMK